MTHQERALILTKVAMLRPIPMHRDRPHKTTAKALNIPGAIRGGATQAKPMYKPPTAVYQPKPKMPPAQPMANKPAAPAPAPAPGVSPAKPKNY
jgi:hypothetical protein